MHSMAMCWLLFGIIFIHFVVYIDAERMTLNQLEKLVEDLKVNHEILSHTISEMEVENNYFKASIKDLRADNEQLKGMIKDLHDENLTQKKINSQLKMEITEVRTLFKSSKLERFLKEKSTLLQTNKPKFKTLVESDEPLKDDHKNVKIIKTKASETRIKQRDTFVDSPGNTTVNRVFWKVNQPVPSNGVAFFAYLSSSEPTVGAHQTFVFDVDHTNIGSHYNHHTGVFTSPSHGVYVFSWSLYCGSGGSVYSELVVNSSPVSAKDVGAMDVFNQLSSTDLAIIELNTGDAVYIRTPPTYAPIKGVISHPQYRSTFSGWKLF